ncbi:IPT/TIG domain-containing protein [Hymenobacter sp. BRD67]|uniref:IPT/TIG domain-containing protein n=1 Tax=Hymenobacter sp. BRD67 TaxID=2675877 RepID=UPI0015648FEC|nr:IPT/TIG domain-containing protein [Hymenobacter sp. BRD67]QKG51916.1 IPT/TIG domain-containing protein [Hymenobacter sp. BRD67]
MPGIRVLLGVIAPTSASFRLYLTSGSLAEALPAISNFSPVSAASGSSIMLTGANLDGTTYVSLDNEAVVPTRVTRASLSLVVPASTSTCVARASGEALC